MNISTWAMKNGLIQCMGCKGYDKSEYIIWHNHPKFGTMPYCTTECMELDE